MGFIKNHFARLVALPVILGFCVILWLDNGNTGFWGGAYNRIYMVLLATMLATAVFAVSRRVWFSLGLTSTIFSGLWLGAYIKYQYLGAQLVVPDVEVALLSAETLFEMGLLPTLGLAGYSLLVASGFWLESPRPIIWQYRLSAFLVALTCFSLLNIPAFYVDLQWTVQKKHTFPVFVQSLWRTRLTEPANPSHAPYCCFKADKTAETFTHTPNKKPNIVVILEESTFEPNNVIGFKRKAPFFPEPYPLKVHTAGGSTWVQEIAFLHGVAPPLYGDGWRSINLFAPGRLDGRIAPQLAANGYRTKTIYPTAGRFYGGQRFHQQLGMQDFIDCPSIPECAKRRWNKMPDEVFFNTALTQLSATQEPTFMFIATMRQHSPHDKVRGYSKSQCAANLSEKQCSILQDYDERLQASVTAYQRFLKQLKALPERTIVVAFGDHIPGDVAASFDENLFEKQDRFRTFFTVWDSAQGSVTDKITQGRAFDKIDIAMLDALVLDYAGFESHYLTDKLVHLQMCSGDFCGFDGLDTKRPTALTSIPKPVKVH